MINYKKESSKKYLTVLEGSYMEMGIIILEFIKTQKDMAKVKWYIIMAQSKMDFGMKENLLIEKIK